MLEILFNPPPEFLYLCFFTFALTTLLVGWDNFVLKKEIKRVRRLNQILIAAYVHHIKEGKDEEKSEGQIPVTNDVL